MGAACNGFRRTHRYKLSSLIATFGSEIDDPVSVLDHIHIVFHNHDGMTMFYQSVQVLKQTGDIVKMQTSGRFIKKIQKPSRLVTFLICSDDLGGQFEPLTFAT